MADPIYAPEAAPGNKAPAGRIIAPKSKATAPKAKVKPKPKVRVVEKRVAMKAPKERTIQPRPMAAPKSTSKRQVTKKMAR
jgi:hypothetical protein